MSLFFFNFVRVHNSTPVNVSVQNFNQGMLPSLVKMSLLTSVEAIKTTSYWHAYRPISQVTLVLLSWQLALTTTDPASERKRTGGKEETESVTYLFSLKSWKRKF